MKCQHALFDVTQHDYCPTCGETNVDKILDERYIVGLSAETARLLKENERLKAWKDQARYWENQSDDLRKENIWLKEEIERLRAHLSSVLEEMRYTNRRQSTAAMAAEKALAATEDKNDS